MTRGLTEVMMIKHVDRAGMVHGHLMLAIINNTKCRCEQSWLLACL